MKVLEGLFYTEAHEWLKVEGDKVYLGITDYAQHELGSIVYVELPEVDDEFSDGDAFGALESVKAASDVYIPADAKILRVNESLEDEPELLNEDCYENWMICFQLTGESQLDALMNAEEYKKLIDKEA